MMAKEEGEFPITGSPFFPLERVSLGQCKLVQRNPGTVVQPLEAKRLCPDEHRTQVGHGARVRVGGIEAGRVRREKRNQRVSGHMASLADGRTSGSFTRTMRILHHGLSTIRVRLLK